MIVYRLNFSRLLLMNTRKSHSCDKYFIWNWNIAKVIPIYKSADKTLLKTTDPLNCSSNSPSIKSMCSIYKSSWTWIYISYRLWSEQSLWRNQSWYFVKQITLLRNTRYCVWLV
jgi:hypothetical protein